MTASINIPIQELITNVVSSPDFQLQLKEAIKDAIIESNGHIKFNQEDDNNQLLTIEDVRNQLKVSRQTIHNLRKNGKLKSTTVGKSIRFWQQDIHDYLKK